MHAVLHGLYLILDMNLASLDRMVDIVRQATAANVRLFQYRDKQSPPRECYRRASRLRPVIAETGGLFIINDRCDLALAVEADGVHLGQSDLPVSLARRLLGPDRLIGLSTHSEKDIFDEATQDADYVGFGPIFPTSTKSDHEPVVGIQGLHRIRPLTDRPIFAIGGITLESVRAVHRAGADGVAMASNILNAPDVGQAIRQVLAGFSPEDPPAIADLPQG